MDDVEPPPGGGGAAANEVDMGMVKQLMHSAYTLTPFLNVSKPPIATALSGWNPVRRARRNAPCKVWGVPISVPLLIGASG